MADAWERLRRLGLGALAEVLANRLEQAVSRRESAEVHVVLRLGRGAVAMIKFNGDESIPLEPIQEKDTT